MPNSKSTTSKKMRRLNTFDDRLPIAARVRTSFTYVDEATALKRGARAKFIQFAVSLAGFPCAADGDAGPVTRRQIRAFRESRRLGREDTVDLKTFVALTRPFFDACMIRPGIDASASDVVVAHAMQHVLAQAMEITPNLGPWVKIYMNGNSGRSWPWCAGFNTFVWRQAGLAIGDGGGSGDMPFGRTFSCDVLANRAKSADLFVEGADAARDNSLVKPGDLFLIQRSGTDWTHTGIVTSVPGDNTFGTVEGNTNRAGSREGIFVMERVRRFKRTTNSGVDFVTCPFNL